MPSTGIHYVLQARLRTKVCDFRVALSSTAKRPLRGSGESEREIRQLNKMISASRAHTSIRDQNRKSILAELQKNFI